MNQIYTELEDEGVYTVYVNMEVTYKSMMVIYPTKLLSMIMYSKHLMGRWSIYPHDLLIFMVDYIEGKETLHVASGLCAEVY